MLIRYARSFDDTICPERYSHRLEDIADLTNLSCPFSAEIPACWLAAADDCSVQLYTDSFTPRSDRLSRRLDSPKRSLELFGQSNSLRAAANKSCGVKSACRISRMRARCSISPKQGGTQLTVRATTNMWAIVINRKGAFTWQMAASSVERLRREPLPVPSALRRFRSSSSPTKIVVYYHI